jgi:flavin-dependent dehydrogenase
LTSDVAVEQAHNADVDRSLKANASVENPSGFAAARRLQSCGCPGAREAGILPAMSLQYDAAIIGGGPAGSIAATLLSRMGRRVVVIEKETFPRFKIGESLLPHSLAAFDKLGIRGELDAHAFPKHGGEIASACGRRLTRFYFENALELRERSAYQVDRAWFDKMLLDRAAGAGAEIRQPCTVSAIAFEDDAATIDTGEGTLRARYLLDCSGRNAVVGSHFDLKRRYDHLQKFSVYAHFEGVHRDAGRDAGLTRLVRGADHWFWLIPLDGRRTSVGLVLDAAAFRAAGRTPEQALGNAIDESPLMRSRMGHARRITEVHATGDYSYRNTRLHGRRWLLAGDAAGFIDPIFSTGVFLAIHSAGRAAAAVDFALRHPVLAPARFAVYASNLSRLMNRYLRFVNAWYTPEFMDVFSTPKPPMRIPQAVNSVLGGNIHPGFAVRWRLWLFYLVLWIQKHHPIVPRLEDVQDDDTSPAVATAK